MSVTNSTLVTEVQSPRDFENGRENMEIADTPRKADQQNVEILRCFVCDVTVQGRRYALATCKTQSTRARVIEKLGELVGERYVVVISEDDVICRSCANLINTLDRLESEMKCVKGAVLRFLERKYSLAEGELLNGSEIVRPGQPPQITRNDSQSVDYHTRKRGEIISNNENFQAKRDKKSNVWMQCDKCRYTTLYNTYMIHHVRQHMKQKVRCDKCGVQFPGTKASSHRCEETGNDNNSGEAENLEEEPRAIQTAPLETIDIPVTSEDVDEDTASMSIMPIQPNLEASVSSKDNEIQLISLTNPNSLQFQNFLANDGTLREEQPMFMRVLQQLESSDNVEQTTLTVPTIGNDMIVKAKENTAKQMLTLGEDGSLEMVAVDCWNEDNPPERDPDMTF